MTEAIYQEVSVKTEKAKEQHRRISVCGMLKYLDVSRVWLPRLAAQGAVRATEAQGGYEDAHKGEV